MTSQSTSETETQAPATEASSSAPLGKRYLGPVILITLIVIMLAQLWTSVVQLSITSDEIDHLHAAYRYWQCNDFGWNPEHPPLVKIVAGLPLQFMHINDPFPHACGAPTNKATDFLAGHQFLAANPESMLMAARFSVSFFAVLLLLSTWFFARKIFGIPVAIIACTLIAFEPNFLAHGALVTTDVAATVGILLAVYALYCYSLEPNFSRLLALGLATGFALCTKFSSILLVVLLPLLLVIDAIAFGGEEKARRGLRYAGALIAVAGIAFVVVWAAYGFRYAARPGGAAVASPIRLAEANNAVPTRFIPQLERWHVLPESYLVGLQDVLVESEIGRPVFLLGKLYRNGIWFFFPIDLSIKFTIPVLLMTLISALSFRFWRRHLRPLLFLMLPVIVFLGFSMRSNLNIGIRHLLPILPPLIIFAAAGTWSLARQQKWMMAALTALLAFQVATSAHAFPNYLSYANELWGGPAEAYRYVANSDVDWGQAQKMARGYIDKTHPSNCFLLRTYNSKNSDYDIPCGGISEIEWDPLETPYTGTMIVSSSMVDGIGVRGASIQTRRVFKDLKPVAKLGGSALLVYRGTFDLSPIVAAQLLFRARLIAVQGADEETILSLAQQASRFDPLSGDAHAVMCGSYHALGQDAKAEQECNLALELVRKDPQYGPKQVKDLERFISEKGLTIYNDSSGRTAQ
jgi:hypothetical protein